MENEFPIQPNQPSQEDIDAMLQQLMDRYAGGGKIEDLAPQFSNEAIDGLYGTAYKFYEIGKYQDAAHFFRVMTMIDTTGRRNWMGLGASLQMLKEYEEAIESYSVAAMMDPEDPYAHLHAAECLFIMGQKERALIALSSAELTAGNNKNKNKRLISQLALIRNAWSNEAVKVEIKEC